MCVICHFRFTSQCVVHFHPFCTLQQNGCQYEMGTCTYQTASSPYSLSKNVVVSSAPFSSSSCGSSSGQVCCWLCILLVFFFVMSLALNPNMSVNCFYKNESIGCWGICLGKGLADSMTQDRTDVWCICSSPEPDFRMHFQCSSGLQLLW